MPIPDEREPAPITRGPARPPRLLRDRPRPVFADRPVARLVGVFLAILVAGAVALALPVSSASGAWTDPLTALFTATSALTGTGLTVVDTPTWWSLTGQLVILVLFVIGGVGVMASTVLLLVVLARRTDLRSRLLLGDGSGAPAGDARGIVIGTALALVATRAVKGFLSGVSTADPFTYTAVAVTLLAVALLASWIPARRAASIDPIATLRHQ